MSAYIARTTDGRYGLTAADEYGYHGLYRIASPEAAARFAAEIKADPELAALIGTNPDILVGCVSDPANIESAADAADEETACLLAAAREEFGY